MPVSHNSEIKRVSLEVAAKTLNQFSPPQLVYDETRRTAEGDFSGLSSKLKLEDTDRSRLQEGAAKYREHIRAVRRELGHRTLLCIANDFTARRESGLYVDSSSIRFNTVPKGETYDFSAINWEFSEDGFLSRNRVMKASAAEEFGAWDIRYVKDASISNVIRESDGSYSQETLNLDDADDDSIALSYSTSSDHIPKRPFHDAFRGASNL